MNTRIKKGLTTAFTAFSALMLLAALPTGCSREKTATPEETAQANNLAGKEHYDKGVQLQVKGQLDEAIKEYEASVQANPNVAEVYNNLGFVHFDKGDFAKSMENQKKAIELNPKLANAYYGLALTLEKSNDTAGAIENWKQFASLSQPHSKWWMKAQERIQELEPKKKH